MAQFDTTALRHLERLSRIRSSPEEEADILASLSRILAYVEQLNEVDTTHTIPCSYVLQGMSKQLLREDIVQNPLPREQFLHNAPEHVGGMVRIPPVMKPQ